MARGSNRCDGRTDGRTDGQTDRRTDGRTGAFIYLPKWQIIKSNDTFLEKLFHENHQHRPPPPFLMQFFYYFWGKYHKLSRFQLPISQKSIFLKSDWRYGVITVALWLFRQNHDENSGKILRKCVKYANFDHLADPVTLTLVRQQRSYGLDASLININIYWKFGKNQTIGSGLNENLLIFKLKFA